MGRELYLIQGRRDVRELASHFLALAEIRSETVPLMIGHRLVGMSLLAAGNFVPARAHVDSAIALYDSAVHRALAARFGQDVRVVILPWRSWALWSLGHPEAALADADQALKEAREIGHAATLILRSSMYRLSTCIVEITLRRTSSSKN